MDRHRFSHRARELRALAERMTPLAKMPDRTTGADVQLAADLATKAADDIDALVKAELTGCVCRRVRDETYDYLEYEESCVHHRQWHLLSERLKADYAKMEKKLKDEARTKLVAATLSGAAGLELDDHRLARNAFSVADEVLRQIAREDA